jgi:ribose transport system substrate-binding protein
MKKNILVILLVSCFLLLAACSSEESSNSKSEKEKLKIGVSIAAGSNNTLKNWFAAIKSKGESLGYEVIGIDSQADVNKQLSTIDNLLIQDVDAMIIWPLDANALKPAINKALGSEIPVVGVDFNVSKGGDTFGLTSQIIFDRENSAMEAAKIFSETFKGQNIEVAGIGMAIPVPGNIHVMKKFKEEVGKYNNLTWVDQQDNPTDNIAGAAPLMANILTKHPNVRAVFTYNDESAIGAAQAIKNAGKKLYAEDPENGIMVIGVNAEQSGIEAIEQGLVHATFNLNPVKAGVKAVEFIDAYLQKDDSASDSTEILIPTPIVTKDSNDFISWEEELAEIK